MLTLNNNLYKNYRSNASSSKKNINRKNHIASLLFQFDKNFLKFLPSDKNAKIIDIGCGSGELLEWLRIKGYDNVEGYDISQEQVDEALKSFDINVHCEDVLSGEAHFPSADVYFFRDVLEHFDQESIQALFDRLSDITKNEIRIIVQTVNGSTMSGMATYYSDYTHRSCFTERSLMQIFKANFDCNVHCYPWYAYAKSSLSSLRVLLTRCMVFWRSVSAAIERGSTNRIYTLNFIAIIDITTGEKND